MSKSRCWSVTINNFEEEEEETFKRHALECEYAVYQIEMGKEGTIHLQGCVYYKNPRVWPKKVFPRAHLESEKVKGALIRYCQKEETRIRGPYEFGKKPIQGERTDLNKVKEDIVKGKKIEEVVMEDPELYHQYGRTLEKIENIVLNKRFRTEMTEGIWYYGPTGVGKSHKAFEGYNPETHFMVNGDTIEKGWWDGYEQQETVIINEFRGGLKYSFLLELLDKWPLQVARRNKGGIQFNSKRVIITSSLAPEDIYKNMNEKDSLEQLYRRCKVVMISERNGTEVVRGNTRTLPTEPIP